MALETSEGTIVLELYANEAPRAVDNFLQYAKSGFYSGTIFHRVLRGLIIHGGGFNTSGKLMRTRQPIQNEADNLVPNNRGTISMAHTGDPHSATAQFFINLKDNAFLNHTGKTATGWGYAVFGKVVEGMDVVDTIAAVPVSPGDLSEAVPSKQIVTKRAIIITK